MHHSCIENKLSLHPGKCEAILFSSKRKAKRVSDSSVKCNNTNIAGKNNIKYLVSTIDQSLSGTENVSNIIKKSNGKLKLLYRHKEVLNKDTRKTLTLALIQGHVDYASTSWYFSLGSTLRAKLQVVQNKMTRFIFNMGPRDHIGYSELKAI